MHSRRGAPTHGHLACICLYANNVSIAWSLVCFASSTVLAVHAYSIGVLQSMPSLPRCLALLLAGAWLATALMASLALIARLCMAPSNVDDVWDAIFSLATCLVLGTMITWLRNRVVLARYEAGAPKRSAMRPQPLVRPAAAVALTRSARGC